MPTRLLLDGQDLRALMLRVRDEMGPHATIVRAERVRTGGIAGFFAREHYELTVELPDEPVTPPSHSRPAPAAVEQRPSGQVAEPVGIEALMAAADEMDRTPQVSTDGDSFAEVLASMQQITGRAPDPGHTTAAPVPPDREEPATPAAPAPPAWVPVAPRTVVPGAGPVGTPTEGTGTPGDEPGTAAPGTGPDHPGGAPGEPEDLPEHERATVAALLELGIPLRLLTAAQDPSAAVPLGQVVRSFERPDARVSPGHLVVVAGPADLAVRTATAMAMRAGLAPTDVVLAGEVDAIPGHGRRVLTTAAATRVRAKVGPEAPTIVALGVGGTAAGALLLSALGPDEAWAAVDARLRGVELRRWLRAVGARREVDAVAANHAFEAQSPGTVLNLGVPVGWLDGLPASPVVWAALLGERLSDDAQ